MAFVVARLAGFLNAFLVLGSVEGFPLDGILFSPFVWPWRCRLERHVQSLDIDCGLTDRNS